MEAEGVGRDTQVAEMIAMVVRRGKRVRMIRDRVGRAAGLVGFEVLAVLQ